MTENIITDRSAGGAGKGDTDRSDRKVFRAGHEVIDWRGDETERCPRCGRGKRPGVICHHNGKFTYPQTTN